MYYNLQQMQLCMVAIFFSHGKWLTGINCQCSAKALEKWEQMAHAIEKYGDIGNFSGVTSVILSFKNLKFVETLAPTAKIIGDIPDFNVLNIPKTQPLHNPELLMKVHGIFQMVNWIWHLQNAFVMSSEVAESWHANIEATKSVYGVSPAH